MCRPTPRPGQTALIVLLAGWLAGFGTPGADRPLAERVEIRRDTFGIPHILAETEEAAAFGLGYVQAEDHIEPLARRYVSARGHAARYFGTSGVENDLEMARLDNLAAAGRSLALLSREYRAVVAAFAAGINQYVRAHRAEVPDWVPEFTSADVMANSRAAAVSSVASPGRLRALAAKYTPVAGRGAAVEPVAGAELWAAAATPAAVRIDNVCECVDEPGSNAFAISGARTESGRPILLGNPHLRWSSLYWEAQITVPGRINFYGSTLVGIPWLRAGFSDRLAYVQTNNAPDLEDVFALPLDPAHPDHYLFNRRSQPLISREVAIDVRQPDGTIQPVRRTYWSSHLGPVIHGTADKVFVLKSVSLESWRHFEGFYDLSHARSLKDFLKRLGRGLNPTSNFTYADADGNVMYLWNARLPKRPDDGTSYELDVPGTAGYVWTKFHKLDDLPRLVNPSGGYVQNANNPPWFVSKRDPIDPRRYPSYVERGELGLRPQIAIEMIEATPRFSLERVREIKFTTRVLLADRVKPALLAAAKAVESPSPDLQRGVELIEAWDNRVAATGVGAVLFLRFWDTYRAAAKQPFAEPWSESRPFDTPAGLADPPAALKALEEAVRWARATYGSEAVAWGEVNRYRFGDLDLPAEGAAGAYGLYRVQQFDPAPDGKRIAGWPAEPGELAGFGDAWVLLVHLTRPVQAQSILAYGQTTNRASPHSRDQIRLFAAHQLRPVWFTEAEIAAHLERRYRP